MPKAFEADAGILCDSGIAGELFVLEPYLLLYELVLKVESSSASWSYLQLFMQPPETGQSLLGAVDWDFFRCC